MEHLGSQRVSRSAYAVKTGTVTTIYFGICERDQRPVRFEMPADLGKTVELPCFAGCTLPVLCERLVAVTTHLDCDGSCRSARRQFCSCGCGGINHGRVWGQGVLLDSREIVESEIDKYRAEIAEITARREARAEAKAQRQVREFEEWAAGHAEAIGWLMQTDPSAERSGFVADMIRKLGRHEILSDNMLRVVLRIHAERTGRAASRSRRDAQKARPGAGDQAALVPGVYELDGAVYVVKPNREYVSWRKAAKTNPDLRRPEGARLYAKQLTERGTRVTKCGERVPAFTLEYAKGVIFRLVLADRMPLDKAREMSRRFRSCIYCGHCLDDPRSIAKGVGTECVKYFGPVLTDAA